MNDLITIYKAVNELTDHMEDNNARKELREKINEVCRYTAKKGTFMMINGNTIDFVRITNGTKYYCVEPKQFYELIKKKFPELKSYIPENYRWTKYTGSLNVCYALNAYAPTPKCTTLEEAKVIIQEQADELRDKKEEIIKLEKSLAEANIIVTKVNENDKKKGRRGNW